jgi:hypothetical protein
MDAEWRPGARRGAVHYATNSELSPRYPNEWEFFGRVAPLDQARGAPIDAGTFPLHRIPHPFMRGVIVVR